MSMNTVATSSTISNGTGVMDEPSNVEGSPLWAFVDKTFGLGYSPPSANARPVAGRRPMSSCPIWRSAVPEPVPQSRRQRHHRPALINRARAEVTP